MTKTVAVIAVLILTSGCASTPASMKYLAFGAQGQTPETTMLDAQQCEQIAQHYKGSETDAATANALVGTVVGSASGAAFGALLGATTAGLSAGSSSLIGLGIGATTGLIIGVFKGVEAHRLRYEKIYGACMTARGYTLGG